jgi:uncharacterized membrane protein YjjP (DUF1212 family)
MMVAALALVPLTGFQLGLVVIAAVVVLIAGFGLRGAITDG